MALCLQQSCQPGQEWKMAVHAYLLVGVCSPSSHQKWSQYIHALILPLLFFSQFCRQVKHIWGLIRHFIAGQIPQSFFGNRTTKLCGHASLSAISSPDCEQHFVSWHGCGQNTPQCGDSLGKSDTCQTPTVTYTHTPHTHTHTHAHPVVLTPKSTTTGQILCCHSTGGGKNTGGD